MTKRPQDHFGDRAKREGFAARSVYKLEEIDKRVRLFRKGMRVLDLGAFPGSWTQYAAEKIGPGGNLVGLDIQEFKGKLPPHAQILHRDVFTFDPTEFAPRDLVMSDMAPSTSGARSLDQYRSYELFMRALQIATEVLSPGGSFVGKIFQGAEFEEARKSVRQHFSEVKIVKPKATRSESYEVFLVGLKFTK